jgi:hypothetical protein
LGGKADIDQPLVTNLDLWVHGLDGYPDFVRSRPDFDQAGLFTNAQANHCTFVGGGGDMHTQVTRTQFEIKDATVIHTSTGAEFIPQGGDSVVVWTGDIGRKLPSGEVYQYGDVLDVMRAVWRESCSRFRPRLEPMGAA